MRQYWLKKTGETWKKVTSQQYISAEMSAGLQPKNRYGIATASFSITKDEETSEGRTTSVEITEKNYSWDPDFLAVARNSVPAKV